MIRGVPYDAEVEWIYMPYRSYLNTGYYGLDLNDFDISISAKADGYPELAATFLGVYGSTVSDHSSGGIIIRQYPSGTLQFYSSIVRNGSNIGESRDVALPSDFAEMRLTTTAAYVNGVQIGNQFSLPTSISGGMDNQNLVIAINARKDFFPRSGTNAFQTLGAGWYKSARIVNSGVLVRDFVPVRFTNELGQTEGAMYDRVTKKLFRNKGTGKFTVGPDVATPVLGLHFMKPRYTAEDYVQDGLVAMWDGIENAGWGVHDPNATVWKDLIGNIGDMGAYSGQTPSWTDNALDLKSVSFKGLYTESNLPSPLQGTLCVDCCVDIPDLPNSSTGIYSGASIFSNRNTWAAGAFQCIKDNSNYMSLMHNSLASVRASYYKLPVFRSCTWAVRSTASVDFLNSRFYIGNIMNGQYTFRNTRFFSIRIYMRNLTNDEITMNNSIDKARFNLPEVTA